MKRIIPTIIAAFLLTSASTAFAQAMPQTTEEDNHVRLRSNSEWVHIPGLRWNIGMQGHDVGLGYLYALEMHYTFWEFATTIRMGVGPDIMLAIGEFEGVNGLVGFGMGRLSIYSNVRGGGIELGAGGGLESGGLAPALKGGIFLGGRHFEIGYAYQHVVLTDTPEWMNTHQLTLRLNLPVFPH